MSLVLCFTTGKPLEKLLYPCRHWRTHWSICLTCIFLPANVVFDGWVAHVVELTTGHSPAGRSTCQAHLHDGPELSTLVDGDSEKMVAAAGPMLFKLEPWSAEKAKRTIGDQKTTQETERAISQTFIPHGSHACHACHTSRRYCQTKIEALQTLLTNGVNSEQR